MPNFAARSSTERQFYKALETIVDKVEELVDQYYDPSDPSSVTKLAEELDKYADSLDGWAKRVVQTLLSKINTFNISDWATVSERLGSMLRAGYASDPVLKRMRLLQKHMVRLIKSLPRKAAERAVDRAADAVASGKRAEDLASEILRTAKVTRARARLIARTEIARANTYITLARANALGVDKYRWRSSRDSIVRPAHRALEGKICRFSDPPLVKGEGRHHPGDFPNCRCYAEPILPAKVRETIDVKAKKYERKYLPHR